jgi:hypothetical protein
MPVDDWLRLQHGAGAGKIGIIGGESRAGEKGEDEKGNLAHGDIVAPLCPDMQDRWRARLRFG